MLVGDPIDTLMNLSTFAFIGAMIWVLTRRIPDHDREPASRDPGAPASDD